MPTARFDELPERFIGRFVKLLLFLCRERNDSRCCRRLFVPSHRVRFKVIKLAAKVEGRVQRRDDISLRVVVPRGLLLNPVSKVLLLELID